MTEEELKKEAEEWLCNNLHSANEEDFIKAMVDIAEPREKQIQEKDKKIAELEKENAELKKQINEWLNAYSDTNLVKVLRDCIYKNEKLSSQEQQQLSAWVECAMDFGSNLDECTDQLTKAREIIKKMLYVSCNSDVLVQYPNCSEVLQSRVEAENFLKESEVEK